MYSLDAGLLFDPLDLTEEVTPEAVRLAISQKQFSVALAMSLRLCDWELVASVVETVPSADGRVSTTRALYIYTYLFLLQSLSFDIQCHIILLTKITYL